MKSREIWVVRPNPNGVNRMAEFIEEGIIAIGWPSLPNLQSLTRADIKEKLLESEKPVAKRSIQLQTGMVHRFAREMEEGDIVFIPNGDQISVARISGTYRYNIDQKNDGYPHQRSVTWIKKGISRQSLPSTIQAALRPQMALFSISKHREPIMAWLEEDASAEGIRLEDILYLRMWDRTYRFDSNVEPHDFRRALDIATSMVPKRELNRADEILEQAEHLMEWDPSENLGIIEDEDHLRQIAQWAQDGLLEQEVNKVKSLKSEELKKAIQSALSSTDEEVLIDVLLNAPSHLSLPPRSKVLDTTIKEMLGTLDAHHKERLENAQAKAEEKKFDEMLSFLSTEDKKQLRKMMEERTEKSQQDS